MDEQLATAAKMLARWCYARGVDERVLGCGEQLLRAAVDQALGRPAPTHLEHALWQQTATLLGQRRDWANFAAEYPNYRMSDDREVRCYALLVEHLKNPVLDARLHLYAGEKMAPDEVGLALKSLFPNYPADKLATWATRFTKLFSQSIYKWVQSPMSLHVGSLDLDRERALQMPVVQKNEWT